MNTASAWRGQSHSTRRRQRADAQQQARVRALGEAHPQRRPGRFPASELRSLHTLPRASSSAWLHDLSVLFSWSRDSPEDESETAAGGREGETRPPVCVLDGANLVWAYGHALARRFGCKVYPNSEGLLLALNYEPWRNAGVRTVALLPSNYARSDELVLLADGCGGDAKSLQKSRVYKSSDSNEWVCKPLDRLVSSGQVTLVRRTKGHTGRQDDDREILRIARSCNGYVCSNDQFREHFRLKGDEHNRPKGVGESVLFRNRRRFNEWGRERRFGCTFSVAPGLDNGLLVKMIAAQQRAEAAEAAVAVKERAEAQKKNPLQFTLPQDGDDPLVPEVTVMSEDAIRNMLFTQPWRFKLPVFFEPHPGSAMLTAHDAFLRMQRERREQKAHYAVTA